MAGQSAFGFIWPLVKLNFFVRFLVELNTQKRNFEINWSLVEIKSYFQSHHMDRKGISELSVELSKNLLFQMAKNSQDAKIDLNKKFSP